MHGIKPGATWSDAYYVELPPGPVFSLLQTLDTKADSANQLLLCTGPDPIKLIFSVIYSMLDF